MITNGAILSRVCGCDDRRRLADGDHRWLVIAVPSTLIVYVDVLGDDGSVRLSASCIRIKTSRQ